MSNRFLPIFFDTLSALGVEYAVLRNYDTLPWKVPGTDIDILIRDEDRVRIFRALEAAATESGYRVWKPYRKNFDIVQTSYAPLSCADPEEVLRVDFFLGCVRWRGFDIISPALLWKNVGELNGIKVLNDPFKTALTLLNSFVFGAGIKEKYIKEYMALDAVKRERVREMVSSVLGPCGAEVAGALESAGKGRSFAWPGRKALRVGFLRSKHFNPFSFLRGILSAARTSFGRLLSPPGLFVALTGPDGCGKSTMNNMMQQRCARLFSGVEAFHLFPKPGIFAFLDKRSIDRWEKRHASADEWELRKKKASLWKSSLRAAYLLFRFWAGYLGWIYPRLVKGRLVIGERWRYDLLTDPASKGIYLPYSARKLVYSLCPRPPLTIVLSGSAGEMARRKAEIPEDEISRQLKIMEKELRGLKGVVFADSTGEVEETFTAVLKALVSA